MEISQRINKILENRQMSVAELQRTTGMKKSTIYDITSGTNKNPRINTISQICESLNISIDELIYDNKNSKLITKIKKLEEKDLEIIEKLIEKMT